MNLTVIKVTFFYHIESLRPSVQRLVVPLIHFSTQFYSYFPFNITPIMTSKAMETYWQEIICGQTRRMHVNLMVLTQV